MRNAKAITMRKLLLTATILVPLCAHASAADAKTCPEVPFMNGPVGTLSGRVTKQHGKSFFKFSEQHPSQTLLLKLDAPLRISLEDQGCVHRQEIAVFDDPDKLTKWIGRRVTITGELGRWGSALVYPSIYIAISSIHRFGVQNAAKR
jgi:hypothetical protein